MLYEKALSFAGTQGQWLEINQVLNNLASCFKEKHQHEEVLSFLD